MKITEIQAKTLLSSVKQPDTWFGLRYNMNLYRGCQHHCIYCDSRSECYQVADFDGEVLVKANAIDLLRRELPRKRIKGTIGTGSMNDPYMPVEKEYELMRQSLALMADFGFGVHVLTKSDLVLRDIELLQRVSRVYAAVSFTITTADDALGKKVEPGATPVSRRFLAMQKLTEAGIQSGVTLMPVLPFIEDDLENLASIVELAASHGAAYILPSFGMTLRDRQRWYYYNRLDASFPGIREKYERTFSASYYAPARNAQQLETEFNLICNRYGIPTRIPHFKPVQPIQPRLL